MDLITLSDVPTLDGQTAKPTAKIVIGRLDDNLRDPRYGKFAITQDMVDSWKKNLGGVFGGQVAFDFDHSSDRGGGTRAAAWIKSIDQSGHLITADVEFSKRGAKAVRNGEYRYTSPTFVGNYTDEHGTKHGPALIGGALTNRPVLRKGMPTLSLSKDQLDGVATCSARSRDSRAQTMNREELIIALGLEPDATAADVAAAAVTLASIPPSPSHTPGAVAPAKGTAGAKSAGKAALGSKKAFKKARKAARQDATLSTDTDDETVTLSADQLAQLMADANAGASAAKQLAEERFTSAWTKALSEGRAAPSQEETMKTLFEKDADLAVKTLDSFVRIVPTVPAGSGDPGAPSGPAPAGVDEDRFALHQEAKQLAAEKQKTDPTLDEGDAYALAAIEIEERQFALSNPGI